ncbi:MAG: hypothetical protein V5786_02830 [Psychromonas sp.]
MAVLIKHLFISFCLLFSLSSIGHTIYAPNDIPLLDNRFRIDPEIDQITFIFNHSNAPQRVILVQPDGHKIHQQQHSSNIAWVTTRGETIVTVQNPMAGPWQAIAKLDGENRIKIISKVRLEVNKLPLKLYAQEYITTHATLYEGNKLLKKMSYLHNAQLSISLIGDAKTKMALYQDDGRHYDQLAFDGELTTRLFVDLHPGRYLLSIGTKNDVFIRNVNKDAVVFPSPINYSITSLKDEVTISFAMDSDEIETNSVSIQGVIKNAEDEVLSQIIIHNRDRIPDRNEMVRTYKLPYQVYTFSGKAYATTLTGREIELQLPDAIFELIKPFKMPEINKSEAVATQLQQIADTEQIIEETTSSSLFSNLWVLIAIFANLLLLIVAIIFFMLRRRKRKKQQIEGPIMGELNMDELQPTSIDIKDGK